LRENKPLATIGKDKLDNSESTDKLSRKTGPMPKMKATRRNYGDQEEDEIGSAGEKEGDMAREQHNPLPSKISNTLKN